MRTTPFFLPLVLLACTGDTSDTSLPADADTDTDTDSDTDADADTDTDTDADFTPEEGEWVVTASSLSDNTCGAVEEYVPLSEIGAIITVAMTGDRTFTLFEEGDDAPDTCTFAGAGTNYTCDVVTGSDTTPQDFGFDAVINTSSSPDGMFSAPSDDTHHDNVSMECVGDDCGTISAVMGATFPCTLVIETVITVN